MANGKIYWFGWATPKGWSGKWRSDSDTPYEAAEHYFPTGSDPIAAIRAAAEACSAAGGGTVYVGCDYPDDGDAFEIDYRAPADSHRLLLKNLNNVVIDFGGATLRQVNFTRLVLATDGAVIDPYADPPEGTPAIGTDGRWIAVGHPLVRVQNCRNVRIENLVLDGNRRDANPSSWGTEAPGTAPNCDTQQSPDHGVHIVGGEDIVLSNVRVVEAKMDGFQTHFATESGNGFSPYDPVRRVTFEDCSAVSCGRIGFGGDWGHEIKLVRCYAAESGMDFVSESVTRKATWTGPSDGVHFEAWEVEAIEKPGHRQLSVEGCTLERNGGRGLVVSGHEFPDGLFVSNCLFDDNGRRTVFSDVTRSFSHLEIAGAGATVANNTFRPILSVAGSGVQPALVFLTVNVVGGAGESWRKAGHRVIANRFVGSDEDSESMDYAWRRAIEVFAQSDTGVPLAEDGGTLIQGNHFQRCWGAAYIRAPYTTFADNSVVDGIEVSGSTGQAAVGVVHFARCTRVLNNLFLNTVARALWVAEDHVTEGEGDCSDLWFCNNIVRFTSSTLLHDAALTLGAACGGRVRLVDNLFDRDTGTAKPAVKFAASGSPTLWRGIILRGNVARGSGWSPSGSPTGPWQMTGAPWIEQVLEASGNDPALPGELGAVGGDGVRLFAPEDEPTTPPDGALWIGVDTPNTGALMFKPAGAAAVNLVTSGGITGPSSATDGAVALFDGTTGQIVREAGVRVDGGDVVVGATGLTLAERASAPGTSAGQGSFWVENTSPSRPMFTDDDGTDRRVILGLSGTSADAVVRYSGTTGTLVKSSAVTLSDAPELLGASDLTVKATHQLDLVSGSGVLRAIASSHLSLRPGTTETALFKTGGGLTLKGHASTPSASTNEGVFWTTNETYTQPRFTNADGSRTLVRGPSSATGNALARFDGTTGGLLKSSEIALDDSGNLVIGNSDTIYWGSTASTSRVSGSSSGSLTLKGSTSVEVDGCVLGMSNNQDIRWGASTATSILGSSAAGGDLTLKAADDLFLNPVDDVWVQANGTTYALFDGANYRLGLDSAGSVAQYADALTVRGEVDASTSTGFVANIVNKSTGSNARVLKLAMGRTTDSTTAFFIRAFQSDATGSSSGTVKWYVRSDGVTPDTFTGKHYVVYEAEEGGRADTELEPGFIVETAGRIWSRRKVDQCLPVVRLSRTASSKKVFGVIAPDWKEDRDLHIWSECEEALHPDSRVDLSVDSEVSEPATVPFDPASRLFKGRVNSVGEGMVWVTDIDGLVEEGDFITSSQVPGHGARQADDLLHSYTVAKCTEAPDWSQAPTIAFEGRTLRRLLVACTYHCG